MPEENNGLTIFKNLVPRFASIPVQVVNIVNGINQPLFIMMILVLFFFRFELNGNEEHYMQLARQFYTPEWVPGSFTFTEFPGTKVLYQYIVGFLLQYLSFESVVGIFRFLLCLLFAFPLAKLYSLVRLNNTWILLHLPILYFFQGRYLFNIIYNQSFFGGEWIFLSVEPKSFAYLFVLYSLYYLLVEKYSRASVFLAFATYFHILVGGWAMAYFSIYHLITERSIKKPFLNGLLYIGCLLPFFIYLAPIFTHSFSPTENSEDIDWIFTYFKQPNHTAIFITFKYFLQRSIFGFLMSLFFFLSCLFVFTQYKQQYNQKLNLLNILLFTGTFIFVILAYFDRTGAFVKYFPFRINALFCFLAFLQLALFMRYFALTDNSSKYVQFGVILWFLLITSPLHLKNLIETPYLHFSGHAKNAPYHEICRYVKQNTPTEATVLFLPVKAKTNTLSSLLFLPSEAKTNNLTSVEGNLYLDGPRDMVRKTERDRYVYFFAAPISPDAEKTMEWYRRVQLKKSILEGRQSLCNAIEGKKVDYVLSDFELGKAPCNSLLYHNDVYYFYEINDEKKPQKHGVVQE